MSDFPMNVDDKARAYQAAMERAAPPAEPARKVKPTKSTGKTSGSILSREALDVLKSPGLAALALGLWSISAASTIVKTPDLVAVFGLVLPTFTLIMLGSVIAILLTVAEVLTSESVWYMLPLSMDIGLTLWWSWPAFAHAAHTLGAPWWSALAAGAVLGAITAWAPERIVFGARRKK